MPDMNENAETQQEYFGKAKEGKVVECFEAYGQCRDSRRIAELEAENERLTVSYETLKLHDEEEIGMLKSENAELKEQNRKLLESCEGATMMYEHLTKAKELLKDFLLMAKVEHLKDRYETVEEAEQFLKE